MDFNAAIQTWKNVLTRPGEQVFEEEKYSAQATLMTALIWIIIAAIVVAIFGVFRAIVASFMGGAGLGMEQMLSQLDLPPEVAQQLSGSAMQGTMAGVISAFCSGLIGVPIGFLIGSGIYWVVAKLLGGTGSFESQTYLLATFSAPLMIVNGVISVVPILGGCIGLFVGIYNLVLTYFALKVAHGFTSGKALLTLLTPLIIALLLACCVAIAVAGLVGLASA